MPIDGVAGLECWSCRSTADTAECWSIKDSARNKAIHAEVRYICINGAY